MPAALVYQVLGQGLKLGDRALGLELFLVGELRG